MDLKTLKIHLTRSRNFAWIDSLHRLWDHSKISHKEIIATLQSSITDQEDGVFQEKASIFTPETLPVIPQAAVDLSFPQLLNYLIRLIAYLKSPLLLSNQIDQPDQPDLTKISFYLGELILIPPVTLEQTRLPIPLFYFQLFLFQDWFYPIYSRQYMGNDRYWSNQVIGLWLFCQHIPIDFAFDQTRLIPLGSTEISIHILQFSPTIVESIDQVDLVNSSKYSPEELFDYLLFFFGKTRGSIPSPMNSPMNSPVNSPEFDTLINLTRGFFDRIGYFMIPYMTLHLLGVSFGYDLPYPFCMFKNALELFSRGIPSLNYLVDLIKEIYPARNMTENQEGEVRDNPLEIFYLFNRVFDQYEYTESRLISLYDLNGRIGSIQDSSNEVLNKSNPLDNLFIFRYRRGNYSTNWSNIINRVSDSNATWLSPLSNYLDRSTLSTFQLASQETSTKGLKDLRNLINLDDSVDPNGQFGISANLRRYLKLYQYYIHSVKPHPGWQRNEFAPKVYALTEIWKYPNLTDRMRLFSFAYFHAIKPLSQFLNIVEPFNKYPLMPGAFNPFPGNSSHNPYYKPNDIPEPFIKETNPVSSMYAYKLVLKGSLEKMSNLFPDFLTLETIDQYAGSELIYGLTPNQLEYLGLTPEQIGFKPQDYFQYFYPLSQPGQQLVDLSISKEVDKTNQEMNEGLRPVEYIDSDLIIHLSTLSHSNMRDLMARIILDYLVIRNIQLDPNIPQMIRVKPEDLPTNPDYLADHQTKFEYNWQIYDILDKGLSGPFYQGRQELLIDLFQTLFTYLLLPDLEIFRILAWGCVNKEELDKSRSLAREFIQNTIYPIYYLDVLDGLIQNPQRYHLIILKLMQQAKAILNPTYPIVLLKNYTANPDLILPFNLDPKSMTVFTLFKAFQNAGMNLSFDFELLDLLNLPTSSGNPMIENIFKRNRGLSYFSPAYSKIIVPTIRIKPDADGFTFLPHIFSKQIPFGRLQNILYQRPNLRKTAFIRRIVSNHPPDSLLHFPEKYLRMDRSFRTGTAYILDEEEEEGNPYDDQPIDQEEGEQISLELQYLRVGDPVETTIMDNKTDEPSVYKIIRISHTKMAITDWLYTDDMLKQISLDNPLTWSKPTRRLLTEDEQRKLIRLFSPLKNNEDLIGFYDLLSKYFAKYYTINLGTLSEERKEKLLRFTESIEQLGWYMRFWKGPGNPYPIKEPPGEINRCNRSQIIPNLLVEMNITLDEDQGDPTLKSILQRIPTMIYLPGEGFVSATVNSLYSYLREISSGQACSGYGGAILIITSQYIYSLLGISIDQTKLGVTDESFHTENY